MVNNKKIDRTSTATKLRVKQKKQDILNWLLNRPMNDMPAVLYAALRRYTHLSGKCFDLNFVRQLASINTDFVPSNAWEALAAPSTPAYKFTEPMQQHLEAQELAHALGLTPPAQKFTVTSRLTLDKDKLTEMINSYIADIEAAEKAAQQAEDTQTPAADNVFVLALELAEATREVYKNSRERSMALTKLDEFCLWIGSTLPD